MGFRRRFIGFTGTVQILLTLAMFIVAAPLGTLSSTGIMITNDAVGTPLWGGIILLMCGTGNIIDALQSPSKNRSTQDYMLPLNFSTLLANLTAFIVSALILGLFSWSMSTVLATLVIHFSTIIVAASLICIFSLFALFADCFKMCFQPPPHHQRPYPVDYDYQPRGMPNQVFKA